MKLGRIRFFSSQWASYALGGGILRVVFGGTGEEVKIGNVFLKKNGAGLVVQSSH